MQSAGRERIDELRTRIVWRDENRVLTGIPCRAALMRLVPYALRVSMSECIYSRNEGPLNGSHSLLGIDRFSRPVTVTAILSRARIKRFLYIRKVNEGMIMMILCSIENVVTKRYHIDRTVKALEIRPSYLFRIFPLSTIFFLDEILDCRRRHRRLRCWAIVFYVYSIRMSPS